MTSYSDCGKKMKTGSIQTPQSPLSRIPGSIQTPQSPPHTDGPGGTGSGPQREQPREQQVRVGARHPRRSPL